MQTYKDNNTDTFQEAVEGSLNDKEHHVVQLTPEGTIELASDRRAIGVSRGKLHSLDIDVLVRVLGKNGTVKVIQTGPVNTGEPVTLDPAYPGKVRALPAAAGTYRTLGIKKTPGAGAAGDVIEIIDVIENVTVA